MAKKSTQNTTSNQTANVVATPTNPAWVDSGLAGMGDIFGGLAKADPHSFVAGPDPLQTLAAGAASRLGRFGGGQTSPNESGYGQPQGGASDPYGSAMSTFSRMQTAGANTYNPVIGGAAGYNPATYGANTGAATTYGATTGNAAQFGGTQLGPAAQFGGAKLGPAAMTGDTQQVQSASLLDNLGSYMSPYTNDVVNASLADYDYGAGQNEGQAKLDMAGDSTFGGSGGAIGLAALREGQSRGRGTLSAGLRDQAFNTGASLSNLDAGRRQDASSQNAQSSLQRALADMQAKNQFGLAQGGFDQQAGLANMDARNTFGLTQGAMDQQTGITNQAATNQFGLANMDALNTASQTNAGAQNQYGLANMDALNQASRDNQGAINTAGQSNAANQQQMNLANMGALNSAGQFNAGQQDTALNRQMAGAQGLVGTANDQQGQQRANIDTQSQLGQILQALQQQQTGAPFTQASLLSSLWGGLPLDLLHGGTTNSVTNGTSKTKGSETGLGGEDAAKIAMAAATMFSDRRLKRDVVKLGERPDGLGVYLYRYLWSPIQHVGVMAQEVLKVKPEAVITTPSGFLAVNYGAL